MIAEHGMEPRLVEQRQRLLALVAAIDEIAHRKQPVARTVERRHMEQIAQRVHAAVQVADHEIATGRIGRVMHNVRNRSGRHRFMIALRARSVCVHTRFCADFSGGVSHALNESVAVAHLLRLRTQRRDAIGGHRRPRIAESLRHVAR
jgi:hypothetical protein